MNHLLRVDTWNQVLSGGLDGELFRLDRGMSEATRIQGPQQHISQLIHVEPWNQVSGCERRPKLPGTGFL